MDTSAVNGTSQGNVGWRRRWRKTVKNLCLMGVSLLTALLIAEWVARLFYQPRSEEISYFRLSESSYYQRDDELGWVPRPNVHGRHDQPGSFESTFSTNAIGLRDVEHAFAKPPGIDRVVVLGDSFAWGFGVNDDETFARALEASLPNTEVINLGVTAYGLGQEIGLLNRLGWRFDPDVVVLTFVMNDVFWTWDPKAAASATEEPVDTPDDTPLSLLQRVKRGLNSHSALYVLFQDVTNQNEMLVNFFVTIGLKAPPEGFSALDLNLIPSLKTYPDAVEQAWQARERELDSLKTLCDERGVRLVIAVVPALQMVRRDAFRQTIAYTTFYAEDFDLDKPLRRLAAFAEQHDIELVDPTANFRQANEDGETLYLQHDMHFTPRGHELFAREIAAHLSQ